MCTLNTLVKEELIKKTDEDLLVAWRQAKEVLDTVKDLERKIREELVKKSFTDAKLGSNKVDVEGGKLIYTKSLSYKIDETAFDIVCKSLDENFVDVNSIVKTKHELSVSAYKKLGSLEQQIVDKMLIVKEDAPKLEFKPDVKD